MINFIYLWENNDAEKLKITKRIFTLKPSDELYRPIESTKKSTTRLMSNSRVTQYPYTRGEKKIYPILLYTFGKIQKKRKCTIIFYY